jgi:hypothetical protein
MRIFSAKRAGAEPVVLIAANSSPWSLIRRFEQSVHSRSSLSRFGHGSLTSALTRALSITQIPTLPPRPGLSARPPARLPAPMPGIQCGCRALRKRAPCHPCATQPIWFLECRSSRIPESGSGNCHREPLVAWADSYLQKARPPPELWPRPIATTGNRLRNGSGRARRLYFKTESRYLSMNRFQSHSTTTDRSRQRANAIGCAKPLSAIRRFAVVILGEVRG